MIIDQGAVISTVPESIASQLGINLQNSLPVRLEGIRGVASGRLVTIDSLRLGGAEIRNLEIAISERKTSGTGLLGTDFLGHFRIHMDYGSGWMELAPGEWPYDGRFPEWWQEKFRFYRGLKQMYEKHLKKQSEAYHNLLALSSDWSARPVDPVILQRALADIKVYEAYVRIVTQKIDDLDRRASDAALPRELRE